jgi:hypothetical protein
MVVSTTQIAENVGARFERSPAGVVRAIGLSTRWSVPAERIRG